MHLQKIRQQKDDTISPHRKSIAELQLDYEDREVSESSLRDIPNLDAPMLAGSVNLRGSPSISLRVLIFSLRSDDLGCKTAG